VKINYEFKYEDSIHVSKITGKHVIVGFIGKKPVALIGTTHGCLWRGMLGCGADLPLGEYHKLIDIHYLNENKITDVEVFEEREDALNYIAKVFSGF
jgi:hypothetical protein